MTVKDIVRDSSEQHAGQERNKSHPCPEIVEIFRLKLWTNKPSDSRVTTLVHQCDWLLKRELLDVRSTSEESERIAAAVH